MRSPDPAAAGGASPAGVRRGCLRRQAHAQEEPARALSVRSRAALGMEGRLRAAGLPSALSLCFPPSPLLLHPTPPSLGAPSPGLGGGRLRQGLLRDPRARACRGGLRAGGGWRELCPLSPWQALEGGRRRTAGGGSSLRVAVGTRQREGRGLTEVGSLTPRCHRAGSSWGLSPQRVGSRLVPKSSHHPPPVRLCPDLLFL